MAKSARSNGQKALRTVRRGKVGGGWQEEADAKRQANLDACLAAAPLPVLDRALDIATAAAAERGRAGNPDKVKDGAAPMATDAAAKPKSGKKGSTGKNGGVKKRQGSKANQKVSLLWSKAVEKKNRKKRGFN